MCTETHKSGYKEKEEFLYRQAIGSLMYLSVSTRSDIIDIRPLDIIFTINKLANI